ncbi:MAG: ABC-F family ATP-binding cassette domain-containing protein [Chitinophagales bacterium]
MLTVSNLSMQFGKRVLFDEVNLKFTKGNCYGVIGANGAGKSTFVKILSGEYTATTGSFDLEAGARMSVLSQNHNAFDAHTVLETVMMGHDKLYKIMKEKEEIYAKDPFTEEDGLKAGELEAEFADMDGWNAESDASILLSNLGIHKDKEYTQMSDLPENDKIRVLLAQAIFGNPDVLLLDEPTNNLDVATIAWLENFLADYQNTVIVVSHDRHFLDAVCTQIVDIDFGKISQFTGNYSFWYESSQILLAQRSNKNKKAEEKVKELKDFIARFSANASKSKQATSRKKALDRINIEEMKPSMRKYPAIFLNQERELGNQVVNVKNLSYTTPEGETLFKDVEFIIDKGEKVGLLTKDSRAMDALFLILDGQLEPTTGTVEWGVTASKAYLPHDNHQFFEGNDDSLIDWLRQYSENKEEAYVRGFLGKMLFTGEESLKSVKVLSGGEKVRCMVSRMMLQNANVVMLNEPTAHLDLESIQAFNNGVVDTKSVVLLSTQDHQFLQSIANRIIEFSPKGMIDRQYTTYDEYLADESIQERRLAL